MSIPTGGLAVPKKHFIAATCCALGFCFSKKKWSTSGSGIGVRTFPILSSREAGGILISKVLFFVTAGNMGIPELAARRYLSDAVRERFATPITQVSRR